VTEAGRKVETRLRAIADAMDAELRALLGADHDVIERGLERIRDHSLAALAERRQHVAT
jgi:hypothetical protein